MKPNNIGTFYINDIPLEEVIRFIDWRFYFMAWRLPGRYEGIEKVHRCRSCEASWLSEFDEKDRAKAKEVLKLFHDTQEMLRDVVEQKSLKINAVYSVFPAYSEDDNIVIKTAFGQITIPTLRQQKPSTDGFCYSLSDFLAEENDYVGAFANTVLGAEEIAQEFEKDNDIYNHHYQNAIRPPCRSYCRMAALESAHGVLGLCSG